MLDFSQNAPNPIFAPSQARSRLILLLGFHIVICCLSLIYVAEYYTPYKIIWFDKTRLYAAVLNVAPFVIVSPIFAFARFSFGYFLGFYFYTMILGYLWIVEFSNFHYDHRLAAISAFASALAFLVPATFITSPIKQIFMPSARAFDNVLSGILILAVAVIAAGAFYNFRLIGIADIYNFREGLEFPAWMRYAMGATSNAALPFAFACFVAWRNLWRAAVVLLLLLLFYPITLNKLALFAPFWLLFLALLSRFFEARIATVLSLLLPVSAGVVLALLVHATTFPFVPFINYFANVNFRMIALPSIALDLYSDFFSTHNLTHFCQISFLKPFVDCPYNEQLSLVMAKAYQVGNLNASLFATEGIASVGLLLAPLAVFGCGLVISLVNRLSSGLPANFILMSGSVLSQVFLNVPLATTLLTNGGAILFLLWYITPRAIFEQKASGKPPLGVDRSTHARQVAQSAN
jgi:hypothetical protein